MNAPNTELLIKDYFLAAPADRSAQCEFVASYINTVDEVILVLDWGVTKTEDYYDAAVDLLGQCGEILIEAITSDHITNLLEQDATTYGNELEILITGIALADQIPPSKRLETITSLNPSSRRLVKAAIIDALEHLKDEVKPGALTDCLAVFSADTEPDEYIQQYAKNALEVLTRQVVQKT